MEEEQGKEQQEFFLVEKILDKKVIKGVDYYHIKWLGYDKKDNTWEPVSNLDTCLSLVEEFNQKYKPKAKKHKQVKRLIKREPSSSSTNAQNATLNPAKRRISSRSSTRGSLPSRLSSFNSVSVNSFLSKTESEDVAMETDVDTKESASITTAMAAVAVATEAENNKPEPDVGAAKATEEPVDLELELAKARELTFDPNLEADRIIGVLPMSSADLKTYYVAMRWKKRPRKDSPRVTLMTSTFAKEHYPQLVIQYYQGRLNFEE